jgi:cytosine/adenosine deaminase-related metal-dependent hydrolase
MSVYRTAWLLPISQPPVRDAWVRIDRGRIAAIGRGRHGDATGSDEIDLGETVVLPGLVNAHTHLELSWMRGRLRDADSFPTWIRAVIALRSETAPQDDLVKRSIESAIDEARGYGTALIGDVSNTLASSALLRDRNMPAVVFHELLGFATDKAAAVAAQGLAALAEVTDTDQLRHTLSPHAPYSVSVALFEAIRAALWQNRFEPSSVHLGESEAEIEFLRDGTGPFRDILIELGVWDDSWKPPRCGPVEYLDRMSLLDERLLVVHGVHFDEPELRQLTARGSVLVTCPRGNKLTRAGTPPIAAFFESGIRVALGTDSLASVPDLNLFAELAEMRRLAPHIPASRLLESATAAGARALGFEADFGTVEAGKLGRLIAVDIDKGESNVEEYLVSGIDASRIRWL